MYRHFPEILERQGQSPGDSRPLTVFRSRSGPAPSPLGDPGGSPDRPRRRFGGAAVADRRPVGLGSDAGATTVAAPPHENPAHQQCTRSDGCHLLDVGSGERQRPTRRFGRHRRPRVGPRSRRSRSRPRPDRTRTLRSRHRRTRPTATATRPTTAGARRPATTGLSGRRCAADVTGAVGEGRHGRDPHHGENRHHHTASPTEPLDSHALILRRTARPSNHLVRFCLLLRLLFLSFPAAGPAASGTSHRARSVAPEYVVARTSVITSFDSVASIRR